MYIYIYNINTLYMNISILYIYILYKDGKPKKQPSYFPIVQAQIWHRVAAGNAPSQRSGHSAVLDAQQRMWVWGGKTYSSRHSLRYNDGIIIV